MSSQTTKEKYENYVKTKKVKDMTRAEYAEYKNYLQYKKYHSDEKVRRKMLDSRLRLYHARKERQALQQQIPA